MTAIVVGRTSFHDSYADANPKFVVREDMGNGTYRCISQDDLDYNGVERFFSAEQIQAKLAWESNVNRLFKSQDNFWATRVVGEVLHYHNGFGEFVRGTVVLVDGKKMLKPTALVGNWKERDLPKRRPNGDVYYPYHANKVVNGGPDAPWQPNESCVYESDAYTRRDEADPRNMEPIDLSVPEMTDEQKKTARQERLIDEVRGIIEARYQNSEPAWKTLQALRTILG